MLDRSGRREGMAPPSRRRRPRWCPPAESAGRGLVSRKSSAILKGSPIMRNPLRDLTYEATAAARRFWWVYLLTGIAWLIFSLVVFRFDAASVKGIGYLAGAIFVVAGLFEFLAIPFVTTGWKILYGLLGVAFIVVGVLSFIRPVNTFVGLSALVAFFLVFA